MSEPGQKTLERLLSKAGLGSRSDARSWIHARRVTVNGIIVENPDHWINFDTDKVTLDGNPVEFLERLYILLFKPVGYITSNGDPESRPTVYDLLKDVPSFVGTVGRLDEDSSGLLLLTNDTQLAERLTNPDHHVPKTYLVKCASKLDDAALDRLRDGIELEDGPTRPATVARERDTTTKTFLEITLTEGRNRQIRRMIEAVGSTVLKLVRTRIGTLTLDGLETGKWRHITPAELRSLRSLAGLPVSAPPAKRTASSSNEQPSFRPSYQRKYDEPEAPVRSAKPAFRPPFAPKEAEPERPVRPKRKFDNEPHPPFRPPYKPKREQLEESESASRPPRKFAARSDSDRPSRPPYRNDGEGSERPPRKFAPRGNSDRPSRPPYRNDREGSERPPRKFIPRGDSDRPSRPPYRNDGEGSERPPRKFAPRGDSDRPSRPPYRNDREGSERPPRKFAPRGDSDRPSRPPFRNDREGSERPPRKFTPRGDSDRPSRPPYRNDREGSERPPRKFAPRGDSDRPSRPPSKFASKGGAPSRKGSPPRKFTGKGPPRPRRDG